MSATEIIEALPKLSPEDLKAVYERVLELENFRVLYPNPDLEGAIEAGLWSLENEPTSTVAEVEARVARWAGKSS